MIRLIAVLWMTSAIARSTPVSYPPFTWDTVPVYLHFGSESHCLNEEEVSQIVKITKFISFEKKHGGDDTQFTDEATEQDALKIKKADPQVKVLFYWNSFLAYPFYSQTTDFISKHPEFVFRTPSGMPIYKSDNSKLVQYNWLNPDFQSWWSDIAGDAIKKFGCDGIFMDAATQPTRPLWITKGWGKGSEEKLHEAGKNLMKLAKEKMGSRGLLIYNGLGSAKRDGDVSKAESQKGEIYLDDADGVCFEHFDQFEGADKACILSDWNKIKMASAKGKITIIKCWPDHDFNWLNKELMKKSGEELEKEARSKISYPLACFLIGAQSYSYFCYSWGYQKLQGSLIDYPEYHKKLGNPKGDFKRENPENWVFTRAFEFADVWVDLEKRIAKIDWKQ